MSFDDKLYSAWNRCVSEFPDVFSSKTSDELITAYTDFYDAAAEVLGWEFEVRRVAAMGTGELVGWTGMIRPANAATSMIKGFYPKKREAVMASFIAIVERRFNMVFPEEDDRVIRADQE